MRAQLGQDAVDGPNDELSHAFVQQCNEHTQLDNEENGEADGQIGSGVVALCHIHVQYDLAA